MTLQSAAKKKSKKHYGMLIDHVTFSAYNKKMKCLVFSIQNEILVKEIHNHNPHVLVRSASDFHSSPSDTRGLLLRDIIGFITSCGAAFAVFLFVASGIRPFLISPKETKKVISIVEDS